MLSGSLEGGGRVAGGRAPRAGETMTGREAAGTKPEADGGRIEGSGGGGGGGGAGIVDGMAETGISDGGGEDAVWASADPPTTSDSAQISAPLFNSSIVRSEPSPRGLNALRRARLGKPAPSRDWAARMSGGVGREARQQGEVRRLF